MPKKKRMAGTPALADRPLSQKRQRVSQNLIGKLHVLTHEKSVASSSSQLYQAKKARLWDFKNADRQFKLHGDYPDPGSEVPHISPSEETLRHKCVGKSRERLKSLCAKLQVIPPLMAWERWQANCKLKEDLEQRNKRFSRQTCKYEYILPSPEGGCLDEGLVNDLLRTGVTEAQARSVVGALTKQSQKLVADIRAYSSKEKERDAGKKKQLVMRTAKNNYGTGSVKVTVVEHKHTYDVFVHPKHILKINRGHYSKLKELYVLAQRRKNHLSHSTSSIDSPPPDPVPASTVFANDVELAKFHDDLYVMLARYNALLGHGMQCALGEADFDTLQYYLQVSLECFASPLNCRFPCYCSAFFDSDFAFGSRGSFFQYEPREGSFEVNPPFIESIMVASVRHVSKLLQVKISCLSFVFIIPGWKESTAYIELESSPFLVYRLGVAAKDHGYASGAQHQRRDRFLDAPFDTIVYVLQNTRGRAKYGLRLDDKTKKSPSTSDEYLCQFERDMRAAFATTLPTDAMRQRRLREGRGFGDLDGGGGVYKGRKKKSNQKNL